MYSASNPFFNQKVFEIPAHTFPFSLTAVSNNNPPTTPTLKVDTATKPINTDFIFTATSTDPDSGDLLRYGFDFTGNAVTPGSYVPTTATLASGTAQTATYQWPTSNTYTVRVRAEDNHGGVSGWSNPITITTTNIITPLCGTDTLASSGPSPLPAGLCGPGTASVPVVSGSNWTWTCTGSVGTTPVPCSTAVTTYKLTVEKTGTGSFSVSDGTNMLCPGSCPTEETSIPYGATRVLTGTNPSLSTVTWSDCDAGSSGDTCIVHMTDNRTVKADYTLVPRNGACGSVNGSSLSTAITSGSPNLCSPGNVTNFTHSGTTYSWTCAGIGGGNPSGPCLATEIRDYNWVEKAP